MPKHDVSYRLDRYVARLELVDEDATAYFDSFFDRVTDDGGLQPLDPRFAIEIAAEATGEVVRDGTIAIGDANGRRHVWSLGAARPDVWSAGRRLIRDLWLTRLLADGPVAFVHASVVDDGQHLVAFMGEKRSGKTTLLLDAVLSHGWSFVTNDCLVLRASGTSTVATCVPASARIRADTVGRFFEQLRKAAYADPVSRDEFIRWESTPDRLDKEPPLYVPHGGLARTRMPVVDLSQRRLILVSATIAAGEAKVDDVGLDAEHAAALLRHHLKTDIRRVAARGVLAARLHESAAAGNDVEQVIARVAPQARVLLLQHLAQVAPVLETIAGRSAHR